MTWKSLFRPILERKHCAQLALHLNPDICWTGWRSLQKQLVISMQNMIIALYLESCEYYSRFFIFLVASDRRMIVTRHTNIQAARMVPT
jgi:hypothetical protein